MSSDIAREWEERVLRDLLGAGKDGMDEYLCLASGDMLIETLKDHFYTVESAWADDPDIDRIQKGHREELEAIPHYDDMRETLDSLIERGFVERYANEDGNVMVRLVRWPGEDPEVG